MGIPKIAVLAVFSQCIALSASACDGVIYTGAGEPARFDLLQERAESSQVILFGERHGVEGHVKAAACLFSELSQRRSMRLVMEQLGADQQPRIDAYRNDHPETPEGLGAELKWWESGWPAWSIYQPIMRVAWAARAPVIAGDLASTVTPEKSAGPDIKSSLRTQFGERFETLAVDWSGAMKSAHCGLIDDERATKLGFHQLNRDLSMANALTKTAARGDGAMLFAGRAHVRKDRGVYTKLLGSGQFSNVLSIAAVTKDEFQKTKDAAGPGTYDFYWVVGESSEDACAGFKSNSKIEGQ